MTAQATALRERAETIKAAFAHEFITPSGRSRTTTRPPTPGLPPRPDPAGTLRGGQSATSSRVVEDADGRIGTGFIGTPALLPALVKIGEPDLARSLPDGRCRAGSTRSSGGDHDLGALGRAWRRDGTIYDPEMNSYNHYAYGAVCQWLFEGVAGLPPRSPNARLQAHVFEPTIMPALSPVAAGTTAARPDRGRLELDGRCACTYGVTVPAGCDRHAADCQARAPRHAVIGDGRSVRRRRTSRSLPGTPRDHVPDLKRRQT